MIYVGQTTTPPNYRWNQHKSAARSQTVNYKMKIDRAMELDGIGNFTFEVIAQTSSISKLNLLEEYLVEQYHADKPEVGYNIRKGGNGAGKMAESTKKLIAQSHIGLKPTPEANARNAASNTGRKHSEETKRKIAKANKKPKAMCKPKTPVVYHNKTSIRRTEAYKQHLSQLNTGKKPSKENLAKRSKSMVGKNKGEKNGMFGISSEKSPVAKLTQQQADAIRHEYATEIISAKKLGEKYGVSKKTILNILHNRTYVSK